MAARNEVRVTAADGEEENPAPEIENPKAGVEIGAEGGDYLYWKLEDNDQPGMVLISAVLTGNNYHFWSRFMTVALGAKGKLGFVNGEIEAPDKLSPIYRKWKQTDCMVFCWILNSLSKEIMEASVYADSAKELWDKLARVYGGWNRPLVFMKKQEISRHRQGSDSVTVYFEKLQKLWNELAGLTPQPVGDRSATKAVVENDMNDKLMQFLVGLNQPFDQMRKQILLMDPLPNVYRAYSSMLMVESSAAARPRN